MVQFKQEDGGTILVPIKKEGLLPNDIVIVSFDIHNEIQDTVATVWSEDTYANLSGDDTPQEALEGKFKEGKKKKNKNTGSIIYTGNNTSIPQEFQLNRAEIFGNLVNDGYVMFLPHIQKVHKAISIQLFKE